MYLRERKTYIHLRVAAKLRYLLYHGFIVKIGKPVACKLPFCFYTRGLVKVVIITKPVLIQQQVNLAAAVATKKMIIGLYRFIAGLSAMITCPAMFLLFYSIGF